MALTSKQIDLVMDTLYDRVLGYKADNDGQMYDEEIELLQDAIDQIDKWIMDTSDEDE
jgi:hypothetical protein